MQNILSQTWIKLQYHPEWIKASLSSVSLPPPWLFLFFFFFFQFNGGSQTSIHRCMPPPTVQECVTTGFCFIKKKHTYLFFFLSLSFFNYDLPIFSVLILYFLEKEIEPYNNPTFSYSSLKSLPNYIHVLIHTNYTLCTIFITPQNDMLNISWYVTTVTFIRNAFCH